MKYTSSYISEPNEEASLKYAAGCFAEEMKLKLIAKLKEGRSGWDSEEWEIADIKKALKEHVEKGDPIDIANFAMFLWNREEETK